MSLVRIAVLEALAVAATVVPRDPLPDLPPTPELPHVPQWHSFEWQLWDLGERIRRLLLQEPPLRSDAHLQDRFVSILLDRRAKRGRQPFFSLLESKACARCAPAVASQLDDPFVAGHAVKALRKMAAGDFAPQVAPLLDHPTAWIRNEAKKYLTKFQRGV